MGTPWDRAAGRYLEEWVPRFVPYYLDLIGELVIRPDQRVLVTSVGPGAEVLAVARAVGEGGRVRATDESADFIAICQQQIDEAGFRAVRCERAHAIDASGGPWDAIVCAFGLSRDPDRQALLRAWAGALAPHGKIGTLTFGPPEESDPFEVLSAALRDLEPNAVAAPPRIPVDRGSFAQMFEGAGLSLVRHTVLRHTVSFLSAEDFTAAIREGRTWRRVFEELGPVRMGQVTARFYEQVGGPTAALGWQLAVTLAIAALPGAEVELQTRPSVIAPPLSKPPP